MKSISTGDLLENGYSECLASMRSFHFKTAPLIRIGMLGFLTGFILALILRRPAFGLLVIVSFGILLYSVVLYPFLAIVRAPSSGKPMLKYKNSTPDEDTFLELIFVCPASKTFFRWPVFSRPSIFS